MKNHSCNEKLDKNIMYKILYTYYILICIYTSLKRSKHTSIETET